MISNQPSIFQDYWEEDPNHELNTHFLQELMDWFHLHIPRKFGSEAIQYFIIPEPASLKENYLKLIEENHIDLHQIKQHHYGYKNRGWGFSFTDSALLQNLMRIFLSDGFEGLAIIAERADLDEDKVINKLMINAKEDHFSLSAIGFYFDCGKIMKVFH